MFWFIRKKLEKSRSRKVCLFCKTPALVADVLLWRVHATRMCRPSLRGWHASDGEQFCQNLAPEDPQGDQLLQREELGLICESCRKIIQKLEDMVGPQPNEDTVTQAASRVCDKMKILRGVCKKIMRTFLRRISKDILTGKKPQAICVDIKICKEKTGLIWAPASPDPTMEKKHRNSSTLGRFLAS